ncbi:response regulator transcription factor [Rhodococcoides fascians]|uniref:response regulator transcription factor n=1 Tax=Rhodococcoides fascians TaxID=1828 RepID=UPI00211B14A5|nr:MULTISPECIES: LuxR C-terminal-related transcriptional regulator [Rhodococcus]
MPCITETNYLAIVKVIVLVQFGDASGATLNTKDSRAIRSICLLEDRIGAVTEFQRRGGTNRIGRDHRRSRGGPSPTSPTDAPARPPQQTGKEVLALMAEGRSNSEIERSLELSVPAVNKHIRNVFLKLDLPSDIDGHRRVLAVLTYLRG